MAFVRILALAALVAAATYFLGWICVPVIGALYAVAVRKRSAPAEAAVSALLGWGALLAWVSFLPAFTTLLSRLGGIFPIPGAGVALLTVTFAMLLAWSSARLVTGLVVREQPKLQA